MADTPNHQTPQGQPVRPRRLRRGQTMRDMVADVQIQPSDLIMPLFTRQGLDLRQPVVSMPGVEQMSPDVAADAVGELGKRGVKAFMLFGVIEAEAKDATGSPALDDRNPVNQTIQRVRDAGHDALMIADLCFCEYTDHGHCGVIDDDERVTVTNDATLELLGKQAVVLAENGADMVAPSGMMDGQVAAIRQALDAEQYTNIGIMSYAIKYASALYGPFRDAGEGTPQFGDRRGYQMDWRRTREWKTELELDVAQGADVVMVKPAAAYLDIIHQARAACSLPIAAYHVSGEFSMIHAAAECGWIDLKPAAIEVTASIKRAGADLIVTYFAPKLAEWLGG